MLSAKEIKEIRSHLENAQNPLFLYDNDPDGLCSYLLFRRYLGRGKGFPIRSFPEMDKNYIRKVRELNADYVFILDKPLVSEEFFEEIHKINVPVVWIDHHKTNLEKIPEFVNYYNSLNEFEASSQVFGEPVTYLSYKISNRKEDIWLAVIGCLSDRFLPEFYGDFLKMYPDLGINSRDAFEILYRSQIGKISRMLSFGLKDSITNVISMQKFLTDARNPYEVFEETSKNLSMHKRYRTIFSKYEQLISKAKEEGKKSGEVLFFRYGGELSISSDIANELSFWFPRKYIAVLFVSGDKVNISFRGKGVKKYALEVLKDIPNSSGGGHEDAVGAQIPKDSIDFFKKRFLEVVQNRNI